MIDFTKIIAGEAEQRETFEELVCQIARRDPPATRAPINVSCTHQGQCQKLRFPRAGAVPTAPTSKGRQH